MQQESSASAIARRVRAALDSADLAAIGELLDPDVRWRAPDDLEGGCQNSRQVLDWWGRSRADGVRARVTEVVPHGDKILVGLKVTGRSSPDEVGGEADRWQVLTVVDGLVTDIRGFDDRADAAARVGLPA